MTKNKGFTAVELVMGASIFLLILGGGIGSLIYTLRIQKKILDVQTATSELDFGVEFMGRALRFAKKERRESTNPAHCISKGKFYQVEAGKSEMTFINHLHQDACQSFWLEGSALRFYDGTNEYRLTSPQVEVDDVKFEVRGQAGGDQEQPRATILMKVRPKGRNHEIHLQTTVSPRYLDVSL